MTVSESNGLARCYLQQPLLGKIEAIREKRRQLAIEQNWMIDEANAQCLHPSSQVYELSYTQANGKPWLLCSHCGLTEEGWYLGYKMLKHADDNQRRPLTFAEWLVSRTKAIYQDGKVVYR